MANSRAGNVIQVDTEATFSDLRKIRAIKVIPASVGDQVILKKGSSSGAILWTGIAAADGTGTAALDIYDSDLDIMVSGDVYVDPGGATLVLLYV